jgi:hypothetical protein
VKALIRFLVLGAVGLSLIAPALAAAQPTPLPPATGDRPRQDRRFTPPSPPPQVGRPGRTPREQSQAGSHAREQTVRPRPP